MAASDDWSLEGQTVLLTGASSGLGAQFAGALHRAGARLILVARRADRLAQLASQLRGTVTIAADLADAEAVSDVGRRAVDESGGVDVLINNAAYIAGGVRAENETPAQVSQTLAVNLVAPILLAQAVVPAMRQRGAGTIINVSSIVARRGNGRLPQAIYAASKGGLEAITREWAAQWGRFGIRVNALAPGFVPTELTEGVFAAEKWTDWISSRTLLPRLARADDLDGAVVFLASRASSYITGQTIVVDGGWSAA